MGKGSDMFSMYEKAADEVKKMQDTERREKATAQLQSSLREINMIVLDMIRKEFILRQISGKKTLGKSFRSEIVFIDQIQKKLGKTSSLRRLQKDVPKIKRRVEKLRVRRQKLQSKCVVEEARWKERIELIRTLLKISELKAVIGIKMDDLRKAEELLKALGGEAWDTDSVPEHMISTLKDFRRRWQRISQRIMKIGSFQELAKRRGLSRSCIRTVQALVEAGDRSVMLKDVDRETLDEMKDKLPTFFRHIALAIQ